MKNISYRSQREAGFAENKYKYNAGTELNEELDVQYYETPLRNYDPQTGRFNCVDMLAEHYFALTPYQFAGNNPVSFNDPFGNQFKQNGRLQQGPDGEYHVGWYNELLWNKIGFYRFFYLDYESSGGGSGSGGTDVFYNIQGLSSTTILNQRQFGDRFGQNKNGEYGFWRTYSFDPTTRGYQEAGANQNMLAEVAVGSGRKWIYLSSNSQAQSSGGGNWDINGDGKFQKNEADNWWLNGGGKPVSVNNANIDWSGLKIPKGASKGSIFAISTTDAFLKLPYETAATYGGTSFKVVSTMHVQVLNQLYHYNMRPNNSIENRIRNYLTEQGRPEGNGTDFMINYYNSIILIK